MELLQMSHEQSVLKHIESTKAEKREILIGLPFVSFLGVGRIFQYIISVMDIRKFDFSFLQTLLQRRVMDLIIYKYPFSILGSRL